MMTAHFYLSWGQVGFLFGLSSLYSPSLGLLRPKWSYLPFAGVRWLYSLPYLWPDSIYDDAYHTSSAYPDGLDREPRHESKVAQLCWAKLHPQSNRAFAGCRTFSRYLSIKEYYE